MLLWASSSWEFSHIVNFLNRQQFKIKTQLFWTGLMTSHHFHRRFPEEARRKYSTYMACEKSRQTSNSMYVGSASTMTINLFLRRSTSTVGAHLSLHLYFPSRKPFVFHWGWMAVGTHFMHWLLSRTLLLVIISCHLMLTVEFRGCRLKLLNQLKLMFNSFYHATVRV